MKYYFSSLLIFLLLLACKQEEEKRSQAKEKNQVENSIPGEMEDTSSANNRSEDKKELPKKSSITDYEGRLIKTGESIASCDCNCFDLSFSSPTQLCINKDDMYILGRIEKTGPQEAAVFLIDPVKEEEMEKNLPWSEFDRNLPIATLNINQDGSLELDWIGFSKDGELAVDYAIFGKKTLEGTYKRE